MPKPSISRIALIGLAALLMAGPISAGSGGEGAKAAPRKDRPNILLVITDDQRWDEGSMAVMPELRAIGKDGVFYKQAYVTNPLCCPSRASIMTGRYSHNTGVVDNDTAENLDQDTTIQARLDQAGYETAIFGKYLNGTGFVTPSHFDRWLVQRLKTDYRNVEFNDQGTIRTIKGYVTDVLKRKTVDHLESLEQRDSKPWFTMVAPIAPHLPAIPAKRHETTPVPRWGPSPAATEEDVSDKPPWVQDRELAPIPRMRRIHARQLRTLIAVDQMMARIDQALRKLDEKRDTLVFFISDNGFSYGEHRMYDGMWKKHPYTSSIKVPFIMRWPAAVEPKTSRKFVTNVDIAPTIYDAARVSPPVEVDGHSLLDSGVQRRFVFMEHELNTGAEADIPDWGSVRYRDHQYVEYYDELGITIEQEYYDLVNDPWQMENLLGNVHPTDDPDFAGDSLLIRRLRTCHGTEGENPCP